MDSSATKADILKLSMINRIQHPNCPPDMFWRLFPYYPLQGYRNPAFSILYLEDSAIYEKIALAYAGRWIRDYFHLLYKEEQNELVNKYLSYAIDIAESWTPDAKKADLDLLYRGLAIRELNFQDKIINKSLLEEVKGLRYSANYYHTECSRSPKNSKSARQWQILYLIYTVFIDEYYSEATLSTDLSILHTCAKILSEKSVLYHYSKTQAQYLFKMWEEIRTHL